MSKRSVKRLDFRTPVVAAFEHATRIRHRAWYELQQWLQRDRAEMEAHGLDVRDVLPPVRLSLWQRFCLWIGSRFRSARNLWREWRTALRRHAAWHERACQLVALGLMMSASVIAPHGVLDAKETRYVQARGAHVLNYAMSLMWVSLYSVYAPTEEPPPTPGIYEHLRPDPSIVTAPINDLTGEPMPYNPDTGVHEGTVYAPVEPTWAVTTTLTDTGNATTNTTNLNNAVLAARAADAVGHTKIVVPAGYITDGPLTSVAKLNDFWIQIVCEDADDNLPPRSNHAFYGTEANRVNWTDHAAFMPEFRPAGSNRPTIAVEPLDVKKYWFRGIKLANPSGTASSAPINLGPDNGAFSRVVAATSSTLQLSSGFTSNLTGKAILTVFETGALQLRVIQSYNTGTQTATVSPDWDVVPAVTTNPDQIVLIDAPASLGSWPVGEIDVNRFLPTDIVMEQCLFDTNSASLRSAFMYGRRIAKIDCDSRGLGGSSLGQSQDVAIAFGPGPFKYTNNKARYHASATAGMAFMPGGLECWGNGTEWLPTNMEIRGNDIDTDVSVAKLADVEVKYGRHGLVWGNYFRPDTQAAAASVLLKLTTQTAGGTNPHVDTRDWIIGANFCDGTGGVLAIVTADDQADASGVTNRPRRIDARGNLCVDMPAASGFRVGSRISAIRIEYNTVESVVLYRAALEWLSANEAQWEGTPAVPSGTDPNPPWNGAKWYPIDAKMRYNVCAMENGGAINPTPSYMLSEAKLGADSETRDNLVLGSNATLYPNEIRSGTDDPDAPAFGLVNRAGRNYRLAPTSLGYRAGPTGADLGCNQDLIDALMAEVI